MNSKAGNAVALLIFGVLALFVLGIGFLVLSGNLKPGGLDLQKFSLGSGTTDISGQYTHPIPVINSETFTYRQASGTINLKQNGSTLSGRGVATLPDVDGSRIGLAEGTIEGNKVTLKIKYADPNQNERMREMDSLIVQYDLTLSKGVLSGTAFLPIDQPIFMMFANRGGAMKRIQESLQPMRVTFKKDF